MHQIFCYIGLIFVISTQEAASQDLEAAVTTDHLDLECHACSYNYHPTANDDCVRNPNALNYTVWCDSTQRRCYEQRQYDINNEYIRTFSRGCEVITREDGCETDQFYELCLYTCDSKRCNDIDRSLGPPPTTPPPPTADTTTKEKDLTCYSCVYSYHPDADDTCVTNPDESGVVKCSSLERECYTYTQYDIHNGYVRSMARGCEVLGEVEDQCIEDYYFHTCWSTCSSDFCNDGTGAPELDKPKPQAQAENSILHAEEEAVTTDHLDLECHACSYNYHPTANDDCVRNPNALNYTVWCDSTQRRCYEQRQYDINNEYIRTFSRGCEVITREDGCETDQFYELCLYTCDSKRCNDNDRSLGPPPTTPPPPTADTTTKEKDLTCYSCVYSYHPDADDTCVTNPDESGVVKCSSLERECYTYTQYDIHNGYVRSMARGCEVLGEVEDQCIEDYYFHTCWSTCSSDFCNDGTGAPELDKPKPQAQAEISILHAEEEAVTTDHLDLECHACSYNYHPTANDDCVRNPNALNYTVWCDSTQRTCYEQRQYDINNDYIRTFSRGCEVITREDGCETDQFYETCLYTCDSKRCNDHDRSIGPPPTTPPPPTADTTTKEKDLTCYSCVYSYHPDADDTCATNPEALPPSSVVKCSSLERECYTYTQYDIHNGYVRSMARGCEVLGEVEDQCIEDYYFHTCWSTCSSDYCNDGTEIPELGKAKPQVQPELFIAKSSDDRDVQVLACYSCVYSYHPDVDDNVCLYKPEELSVSQQVLCNGVERDCYTFMQYDKISNHVRSFSRGCEVLDETEEGCTEDTYYETCWMKCKDNLCNTGDGWPEDQRPEGINEENESNEPGNASMITISAITLYISLMAYWSI